MRGEGQSGGVSGGGSLGAFEARRPWGRAEARLFVGDHPATGSPVLIWCLGAELSPTQRAWLWMRLGALAPVEHPGFASPYYFGQVGPDGGDGLVPGEAYLVLPFPDLGILDEHTEALPWRACRNLLLQLLDALAGLHGRGLALGEFGPESVLLFERGEGRVEARLAPLSRGALLEQPRGLPRPCDDFMSLARLGASLAWGEHLPAHDAQRKRVLPPGYPSGFAAWLLMAGQGGAASPLLTAVGLARSLAALGEPGEATARGLRPGQTLRVQLTDWYQSLSASEAVTNSPEEHSGAEPWVEWLEDSPPRFASLDPAMAQEGWDPETPAPVNWRGGRHLANPEGPALTLGAPLAGLRQPPLSQRFPERDALWRGLISVLTHNKAQALVLRGKEGVGKGALSAWLGERAHGLLGARVLRATHSPTDGDLLPLGEMLLDHLRVAPGDGAALREALASFAVEDPFEEAGFEALSQVQPQDAAVEGLLRDQAPAFRTAQERYALIERHLRRLSRVSPVVVLLDGVQWGRDSLGFVQSVLKSQRVRGIPVLFILTVETRSLSRRPLESEALDALLVEPGAQLLEVAPLSHKEHGALAREACHLDGRLAALLVKESGGSPLMARELALHWLEEGALEGGARGYVLRPGRELPQVKSPGDLWSRRLQSPGPVGARALTLGAVLGPQLRWQALLELFDAAGLARGDRLLLDLIRRGLLVPKGPSGSLTFPWGGLWRAGTEESRQQGHLMEDQRLAGGLDALLLMPETRARLHLAGGEAGLGTDALLIAAEGRRRLGEISGARALCRARQKVLERKAEAREAESYGVGLILEARLALQGEDLQGARQLADEADRGARAQGWRQVGAHAQLLLAELESREGQPGRAGLLARRCLRTFEEDKDRHGAGRALMVLGNADWERGDLESAAECFRRGEGLFRQSGDVLRQAACVLALGSAARIAQDQDKARRRYKEALSLFEVARDQTGRAQSLEAMGLMAKDEGDLARARILFKKAVLVYGRVGRHRGVANGLNHLAEVSRAKGSLGAAEAGYRRSIQIYEGLGLASSQGILPRMNLGLLELRRARYGEGRRLLEGCLEDLRSRGRTLHYEALHGGLTLAAAGLGDWDGFDRHLKVVEDALKRGGRPLDADDAWPLQRAGELCAAESHRMRARRALLAALGVWRSLGDSQGIDRTRQAMDALAHVEITGVGIPAYSPERDSEGEAEVEEG